MTAMIGALILGLFAGFIGRALVPNDVFSGMDRGPQSWAVSVLLGLVGAFVGYLIFTRGLGIGDNDAFDLGGIISAIIGVVIVLVGLGFVMRRAGGGGHATQSRLLEPPPLGTDAGAAAVAPPAFTTCHVNC